jgi:putative phage-type endonuclease
MIPKVKALLDIPQPVQRSDEWFEMRKLRITASNASTLLPKSQEICGEYVTRYSLQDSFVLDPSKTCNPYSNKLEYLKEKAGLIKSNFSSNFATDWGQKYEPIATNVYSLLKGTEVIDFGLLPHKTITWLGASPDGITPDGVMLEIKCPARRKITGIPTFYYWIQVQIQLEVCDLDTCDFFECEFVEYLTFDELIDDTLEDNPIFFKGFFIELAPKEFIYPDPSTINDPVKMRAAINGYQAEHPFCNVIYYKLVNYSNIPILRSKEWFSVAKEHLAREWDTVLEFKKNNQVTQN